MPERTELRDLAGLTVMVVSEADDLDRLVDWHFGSLPLLPDSSAAVPSLKVKVRRTDRARATVLEGGKRIGRMTAKIGRTLVAEHDAGGCVSADINGAVLTIWSKREDEWLVFRQLMYVALSFCLVGHDRVVLHGALVSRDERGLLVVGATGQGKSTFALASLRAGDLVHTDDMTVATITEAGPRLWGVPKRLTVPADVGEISDAPEPVPGDNRDRMFLSAASLGYGSVDDVRVVVAGHHDGGGDVTELTPQETIEYVIASFVFADEPTMLRRCFATLVGVGSAPGFRAGHGAQAATRLDVAIRLLDTCYADD